MNKEQEIAKRPYRIQGTAAYCKGDNFHRSNKAYSTFDEAEQAAGMQACNASNIAAGNKFIIYKALAIVGPTKPPVETIFVDDIPFST
jgi:hypothetical protein